MANKLAGKYNFGLGDNSIDSDQYVDGSIDNAHLADEAVGSEEIAHDIIQTITVDLSPAQIRLLASEPVTIVAAQAGKVIQFIGAYWHFTHGTSDYEVQNNWMGFKIGDAKDSSVYRMDLLERSTDSYGFIRGGSGMTEVTDGVYYDAVNKALTFSVDTRNPTGAGATGTVRFKVYYRILNFS